MKKTSNKKKQIEETDPKFKLRRSSCDKIINIVHLPTCTTEF